MKLNGKTALVTGGAQGLGLVIGQRLARDGATVVIADLNIEAASKAADSIVSADGNAIAVEMNVADLASVSAGMKVILDQVGKPTILINNAAILKSAPALEFDLGTWQAILDVNLNGYFHMAREVLPGMIENKWGRIVNMSSMMSMVAFGQDPAYCTTKAGVLGLTRSLAAEFGAHNICVNSVCPGNVDTEMMRNVAAEVEVRDGLETGSFLKAQADRIPMRRLGDPEDVAGVISFLCSPDANYVTGQSIHVNGGLYYH